MDLGKVQGCSVLEYPPHSHTHWLKASVPSEMKGEGQEATSPPIPDPAGLMTGVGGSLEPGCVHHRATLWLCGCEQVNSSKPPFSYL